MAIDNGVAPKNPVQQKFKAGDIADPKTLQKVQQNNASNQPILREQTLGGGQPGGNFYYGPGIQQGGVNSQVSTGAMAPIPNQVQGMNVPKISNETTKMDLEPVTITPKTLTAGTTVVNNTQKSTGGAKGTNTQQQAPKEPEGFWENGVWYKDATDRNMKTAGSEFGIPTPKETPQEQEQPQQDDKAGEQAISQMESDLAPESGMIYGRATGDSSNPSGGIQTNVDEYSASYLANQGRVSNMNALQSMDSQSIAASIISGTTPYGSQAMRDLMQYNPQKYEEIQNAIKQLKGQNVVNGIASGNLDYTTGMNGQSNIANDKTDFALSNSNGVSSVGDILKNVNETLASNQVASTAQEQMGTIENDMINLQNRLKNLQDEARKVFKGDVPAYVIQAYVSNRTAEIQDQLSVLDQRYNAAYNRYQQEWEQTKWNAELDLKKQELEMKKQSLALDEWSTRQGISLKRSELNQKYSAGGTSTTITGNTVQTTSASRSEISSVVDNLVTQCQNGQLGNAQCAAGIQKNYLPYLGVDLGTLSAYSAKQGICNEDTSYIPQKGDLVVMSSPTQPQYGHIGIVTGVNGTTLEYLDWNGTVKNGVGTEEPEIRTIQLTDSKLYGYYNPTKSNGAGAGMGYFNRKDGVQIDTANTRFANLSLDEQKTVEGLINRQTNPAELSSRFGEKRGALLKSIAAEIDPEYTDSAFATAKKTRNDWSTSSSKGSNSRNGTAVATAMELYNMADKIGNTKFKDWNNMMNFFKSKMSQSEYAGFLANLNTLAFEYAGALKGGASPTEKDVQDAKEYITANLGKKATQTTAMTLAQMLYNKNVNEAQNYYSYTFEKAPSIWDKEVEEWMIKTVGLNLADNYKIKSNVVSEFDGFNKKGGSSKSSSYTLQSIATW